MTNKELKVYRDALDELEQLRKDLASTRKVYSQVCQAIKKRAGYKNWPKYKGNFVDFVCDVIICMK